MRSAAATPTRISGRCGCCGTCCLPAFWPSVSMFVVKLFAASAIALGRLVGRLGTGRADDARVVDRRTSRSPATARIWPRRPISDADACGRPTERTPSDDADDDAADAEATRAERHAPLVPHGNLLLEVADRRPGGRLPGRLPVGRGRWRVPALRRDIDGVQTNEVYVDQADEFGMPPLADEATTGVPEVAPGVPGTSRSDTMQRHGARS